MTYIHPCHACMHACMYVYVCASGSLGYIMVVSRLGFMHIQVQTLTVDGPWRSLVSD